MKKLKVLFTMAAIMFAVVVFGQEVEPAVKPVIDLGVVLAVIGGVYEVLSRVVPTSKTWSIVGNVLNILKKISETFDFKKSKK